MKWFAVLFVVFIVLGVYSFVQKRSSHQVLAEQTVRMAVPYVSLIHVTPTSGDSELILPGNIQSYVESPIYARTNGYLKKWYKDVEYLPCFVTARRILSMPAWIFGPVLRPPWSLHRPFWHCWTLATFPRPCLCAATLKRSQGLPADCRFSTVRAAVHRALPPLHYDGDT